MEENEGLDRLTTDTVQKGKVKGYGQRMKNYSERKLRGGD